MSATTTEKTDWREQLKLIGKQGFIRAEMTRLGFWPPNEEVAQKAAAAEADLAVLYEQLKRLRLELRTLDTQIGDAQDIPKLIEEIRRRRIERVRDAREVKRQERAQALEAKRLASKEYRRKTVPFLGQGVSKGLRYSGTDTQKLTSLGLPILETASDVAHAIGITEQELAFLTYHRVASRIDHYHRFTIPKRTGGLRTISAPKSRLRVGQEWLLTNVLSPLPVHKTAMAFRPGLSIVDNAKQHVGKEVVIRMDLEDFFPSITFPRVKGLFQSFGYCEGVATIFALLSTEMPRIAATLDGEKRYVGIGVRQLPQGACTSPAITNLLCRTMDEYLYTFAIHNDFTYTRYADDLVFSCANDETIGQMLKMIREYVGKSGFRINEKKTAVMRPHHRQAVTGIVVNETPHVSRRDLRKFRAFLHRFEKLGAAAMTEQLGRDAHAYASGYLSFLHMVAPEQAQRFSNAHPWLTTRQ